MCTAHGRKTAMEPWVEPRELLQIGAIQAHSALSRSNPGLHYYFIQKECLIPVEHAKGHEGPQKTAKLLWHSNNDEARYTLLTRVFCLFMYVD